MAYLMAGGGEAGGSSSLFLALENSRIAPPTPLASSGSFFAPNNSTTTKKIISVSTPKIFPKEARMFMAISGNSTGGCKLQRAFSGAKTLHAQDALQKSRLPDCYRDHQVPLRFLEDAPCCSPTQMSSREITPAEFDEEAPVTREGQIIFFAQFLARWRAVGAIPPTICKLH